MLNIQPSNIILLIFPLIVLVITFAKSTYAGKGEYASSMWDREQSHMLQAFACINIVIHHLTQEITSYGMMPKGPITIYSSMGILFTSVFFFFSGYGLITSVYSNEKYLDTFIRHRFPIILVPFIITNAIQVIIRVCYVRFPISFADALRCIFGIYLINGNGWYIIEIFILYVVFYILFKIISKRDFAMALLCVATIAIIIYASHNGHDTTTTISHWFKGEWWYNSTIVFIMGMLFARFKPAIVSFAKKYYYVHLVLTAILFVVAFVIEEKILHTRGYYRTSFAISPINDITITLITQSVLCVIFTWLILLINMKITLGNKVLSLLSTISLELFLVHGIFVTNTFDFDYGSNVKYYASVIVLSVAVALILKPIDRFIISLLQGKSDASAESKSKPKLNEYERRVKQLKNKKRNVAIVVSLVLLCIIVTVIYSMLIRPRADYKNEVKSIAEASIGDEISFGRYDIDGAKPGTERVEWIVLDETEDKIMLMSKYGIAGSVYYNQHKAISWKESDLNAYLNKELYNSIFTKKEQAFIAENPETHDYVSLLSPEQAELYFTDDLNRQLEITDMAKRKGTNINTLSKVNYWDTKDYRSSWWWLRGEGTDITAPIVSPEGSIVLNDKFVNKPNGAVRPVIWLQK